MFTLGRTAISLQNIRYLRKNGKYLNRKKKKTNNTENMSPYSQLKKCKPRDAWLVQSIEHATPDLKVMSSRPMLGVDIT